MLYISERKLWFSAKNLDNLWQKFLAQMYPHIFLTFPACTTNVFVNQALRQSYSKSITKHWCRSWVKKLFKFSKLVNNSIKECRHRMDHSFFMFNNFLFWKIVFCWWKSQIFWKYFLKNVKIPSWCLYANLHIEVF